jgi:hypothetical protein
MLDTKTVVALVGVIGVSFGVSGLAAQSMADAKEGVSAQKVSFRNKTITVVGNLFRPASFDTNRKHGGIVVVHPHGGVKEQTAGLYARRLAEQGFMTLAYDASYWGESSGETRNLEVPATRIEDISCAIDYLSTLPAEPTANPGQDGWRVRRAMAKLWRDAVNRRGGDVTLVHLPEIGIRGNTHFPMSDMNNLQIADLLSKFLSEKKLD